MNGVRKLINQIEYEEKERWRETLEQFEQRDVYNYLEYLEAFKRHGDGLPLMIYGEHDNTKFCNIVMKRDITDTDIFSRAFSKDEWFDIITPYGYGGIIFDNPNEISIKILREEYQDYCRKKNIISEFVRFHPVCKNHILGEKFFDVKQIGPTVLMDLSSQKTIWDNLESKNRNMIRKAKKNGVKIYMGRSPGLFTYFHQMYDETMRRDKAQEYYYFKDDFYESILDDLVNKSVIFYAEYENQIIAMAIILLGNRQLHYHLSASHRKFANLAPTNLLLYEVAVWGAENGFRTFHLGGGLGGRQDSLFNFKKAFNRRLYSQFYIGKQIYNLEMYQYLCDMRRDTGVTDNYFPLYRMPKQESSYEKDGIVD